MEHQPGGNASTPRLQNPNEVDELDLIQELSIGEKLDLIDERIGVHRIKGRRRNDQLFFRQIALHNGNCSEYARVAGALLSMYEDEVAKERDAFARLGVRSSDRADVPSGFPKSVRLPEESQSVGHYRSHLNGNRTAQPDRKSQVDKFIASVLTATGRKITRKNIWSAAGYKDRTEFQRFQKGVRASQSAIAAFGRVLSKTPDAFLFDLDKKLGRG